MSALAGGATWHALYTRSRHEKRVAAGLERRGFDVYLPLIPRVSHWHDRRKIVHWPLFPGYVFVRFGRFDAAEVLGMPGVATVVRAGGAPATIADEEIENVRRITEAIAETGSVPRPEIMVERGQPVRVMRGPFAGVSGIVLEQRGSRVTIQVGLQAIRQAVRLEMDVEFLKPIAGGDTRP